MKPKLLGVLILLAFGALKVPLEDRLTLTLRAGGLQLAPPQLGWQENFGQMMLSTLGGLRNVVASITYLQAFTAAFDDRDWGTADTLMTMTTRLQPTEPIYWDHASWFMAFNAASSYLRDKNRRFADRQIKYRDHVQRGISILEEGLRYNPGNPLLLQRLGEIYRERQPDPRLSAKYFLEAYEHGAASFYERAAAYQMVQLSDRASWEKAYEILKRYYDEDKRYRSMASILRDLPILEKRLNIPEKDRIHPPQPYVPQIPRVSPRPTGR
jgi:tetratricopeptide (TPR) repeat protein